MASNATEFKSNLKKYGKALESKLSHVDRCILIDSFILFLISLIPFWHTGFTGLWNKTDLDFPIYPIQNFLKKSSTFMLHSINLQIFEPGILAFCYFEIILFDDLMIRI